MSQHQLRSFMFGIIAGIAITVASAAFASYLAGVKWEPVKIAQSA